MGKSNFYSSVYKPSASLIKEANEYMTGRLGKNNVFTSLKMLPCLYGKCEFELEDYHNLFRKKVQNDWDSFSGFYAQETGVDSPLVQVPTRGGVLVS